MISFFLNVHHIDSFRPYEHHRPVGVRVSFDIYSIEPISDESMIFQLGMYLNMTWIDPRVKLELEGLNKTVRAFKTVPNDLVSKFWIPDVLISNEKG